MGNEVQRSTFKEDKLTDVINKLNDIDNKLQLLLKSKPSKSLCEQILERTYVIVSADVLEPKLNPSLFILDLDSNRVLITFQDTMELLKLYFKVYKKDVEQKLPRRLYPLFSFLKKNGLIYLDHEDMEYKLI